MADSIDLCSVRGISLRSPKAEKMFWHYQNVIRRLRNGDQPIRQSQKLENKRKEAKEFLDKNRKFHITV